MTRYIQIFTTTDERKVADKIASVLVRDRVAACVQILGPVSSTFKWNGKVTKYREWLCIIKTKQTLYKKAEARIRSVHNYSVPEILAVQISSGNKPYLEWLDKNVK